MRSASTAEPSDGYAVISTPGRRTNCTACALARDDLPWNGSINASRVIHKAFHVRRRTRRTACEIQDPRHEGERFARNALIPSCASSAAAFAHITSERSEEHTSELQSR